MEWWGWSLLFVTLTSSTATLGLGLWMLRWHLPRLERRRAVEHTAVLASVDLARNNLQVVIASLQVTADGAAQLLADLANSLGPAVGEVRTAVEDLPPQLAAMLAQASRFAAPTGAFLPQDAEVAKMERELRAADDHFVSADGAMRFSPLHSSPSDSGSRPGRSRPAPRRSGAR